MELRGQLLKSITTFSKFIKADFEVCAQKFVKSKGQSEQANMFLRIPKIEQ